MQALHANQNKKIHPINQLLTMKITQLYITSHLENTSPKFRGRYQNMAAYLTEFVSIILKRQKLDLGEFNRLVLEEGAQGELYISAQKALWIPVSETFPGFEQLKSPNEVHKYFTKKYIEGLKKFDRKYGLNIAELIEIEVNSHFKQDLFYEKKLASKHTFKVVGRWYFDKFQVVLTSKCCNSESIIYQCEPDPWVIDFDVKKVLISEKEISIINKVRQSTVNYKIQ